MKKRFVLITLILSCLLFIPDSTTDAFKLRRVKTMWVEDAAYGSGWNGDTKHAPSQNALYDYLSTLVVDETDPIVGAVTGIVEADGAGNISAATEGTDYPSFTMTILDDADIIDDNITAAQCRRGITITNDGKGGVTDYNLPAGVEGMIANPYAEEAHAMTIDLTNSGDIIVLPTGPIAAGNAVDSDGNAYSEGTFICHEGTGAGDGVWYLRSQVGPWVDGGAD